VALQERNAKLEGFPQLLHWFRIVDVRKEVMEVRAGGRRTATGRTPPRVWVLSLPGGCFAWAVCGILEQNQARRQVFFLRWGQA